MNGFQIDVPNSVLYIANDIIRSPDIYGYSLGDCINKLHKYYSSTDHKTSEELKKCIRECINNKNTAEHLFMALKMIDGIVRMDIYVLDKCDEAGMEQSSGINRFLKDEKQCFKKYEELMPPSFFINGWNLILQLLYQCIDN